VPDLLVVLVIAVIAGAIGLGFGIVVLAPRIGRVIDRGNDAEEDRDRRD
jgi:hypothetical protein